MPDPREWRSGTTSRKGEQETEANALQDVEGFPYGLTGVMGTDYPKSYSLRSASIGSTRLARLAGR